MRWAGRLGCEEESVRSSDDRGWEAEEGGAVDKAAQANAKLGRRDVGERREGVAYDKG